MKLWRSQVFLWNILLCIMIVFVFLCSKEDSRLKSWSHSKETTPSIALDLHFHCWTGLFIIIHMVQATDVYIQQSMSYTVHSSYLATYHLIEHLGWHHHQCIVFFSVLSALFSFTFFIFFVLAPRWVCMSVVLWVDVQTGCVWAGVPLSVQFFSRH